MGRRQPVDADLAQCQGVGGLSYFQFPAAAFATSFTGLATREIEVLRLVADGFGTSEIAHQLSYSERTVKNVLHDITTRLQLRNRSHAVAYALRQGLI